MVYLLLLTAIAFEVFGTSLLGSTDGFTRLIPTIACLGAYAVSFVLLAQVVKTMSTGTAYAIWSAVGTMAVVVIGIAFLGEALTVPKTLGIVSVVAGVTLLNLGGAQ